MFCIGVDPDLHDLAFGFWDESGPVGAEVISIPKSIKGEQAVLMMIRALTLKGTNYFERQFCYALAVENQELTPQRGRGLHARPIDIVRLGHVAAAVVALGALHTEHVAFPTPSEWKGQVPKDVMQRRLYASLGWGWEDRAGYAVPQNVPEGFKTISSAQWKHVGDALLLAKWCFEWVSKK